MAYNEKIADRIREYLLEVADVIEKRMFGGLCFMVNNKMCIGVVKNEMMCRINPEVVENALAKHNYQPMDFKGKPMKGYV